MKHRDEAIQLWTVGERRVMYTNRIFRVTEADAQSTRPGPDAGTFFRMECGGWVNVIARTADRELVFVEQYRHGTESITLEIPGGLVDSGEEPLAAGVRELREESGFAGSARLLGSVHPNPAIQSNTCWTVLVDGVERVGDLQLDAHEEIAVHLIPEDEVPGLIRAGRITHSLVIAAFGLLWAEER